MDTTQLAAVVSERHSSLLAAEGDLLVLAAHWADRHGAETQPPSRAVRGGERARPYGGDGTPWVLEFAAAEFGALQDMSAYAAGQMMADALDIRHRLPRLWRRLCAGEVRAWKARKIAQATRQLSVDAADYVDRATAEHVASLPWGRFQHRLAAKIIAADPGEAELAAQAYAAERFVRAGQSSHGLKTLVVRAAAGDVIWFDAMVSRIAQVLAFQGDTDPVEVRRSKAIGVLAQPARALLLLRETRTVPCEDIEAVGAAAAQDEEDQHALTHDRTTHDRTTEHAAVLEAGEAMNTWLVPEMDLDPGRREPDGTRHDCDGRGRHLDDQRAAKLLDTVDSQQFLPPVTLYLHLYQEALAAGTGPVRFEDVGPVTLSQLQELLGTGCRVSIQPVLDLNHITPADGYEAPERIREALRLRTPAEVFPFAAYTGRRMDFDHTVAYRPPKRGGPPGQTGPDNGGFLSRFSHRLRTHGRWQIRQPTPGTYLWRSPHGWHFLVNDSGTHHLGREQFARAVWVAADTRVDLYCRTDTIKLGAERHPALSRAV